MQKALHACIKICALQCCFTILLLQTLILLSPAGSSFRSKRAILTEGAFRCELVLGCDREKKILKGSGSPTRSRNPLMWEWIFLLLTVFWEVAIFRNPMLQTMKILLKKLLERSTLDQDFTWDKKLARRFIETRLTRPSAGW